MPLLDEHSLNIVAMTIWGRRSWYVFLKLFQIVLWWKLFFAIVGDFLNREQRWSRRIYVSCMNKILFFFFLLDLLSILLKFTWKFRNP